MTCSSGRKRPTRSIVAEFYTPEINQEWWGSLSGRMSYFKADFTDVEQLRALGEKIGDGNAVFYLAVAARFFSTVAENLGKAGVKVGDNELTMIPSLEVKVTDKDQAAALLKFVSALEDLDDVQNVYSNFDIEESILEAVSN